MTRVLLIGIEPDQVDFTDPALPPGLTADAIRNGVALSVERLQASGRQVRQAYLPAAPDAAVEALDALLADGTVEVVVIGGGVHIPLRNRPLFEAVLNAIGRQTPTPAIALIPRPQDAAEGVDRVLPRQELEPA